MDRNQGHRNETVAPVVRRDHRAQVRHEPRGPQARVALHDRLAQEVRVSRRARRVRSRRVPSICRFARRFDLVESCFLDAMVSRKRCEEDVNFTR